MGRRAVAWRLAAAIWLAAAALLAAATPHPPQEAFVEEALVAPLHDGLVLVHLHFTQRADVRRHYALFPRAIGQLAAAIPFDSLELSLTQGRWHYPRWGEPPLHAKPAGAELRAAFSSQLPPDALPDLWSSLSHTVGGLFCASLNFVARQEATAAQAITMQPQQLLEPPGNGSDSNGSSGAWSWQPAAAQQHVLYAALPQEASCTENLTPWLKLLPCSDAAGLGRLLTQRSIVFGADYHSLHVAVRVARDEQQRPVHTSFTQSLTLVLRSPSADEPGTRLPPQPGALHDLDLAALLGVELAGACPLAQASRLYLRLPQQVQHQLPAAELQRVPAYAAASEPPPPPPLQQLQDSEAGGTGLTAGSDEPQQAEDEASAQPGTGSEAASTSAGSSSGGSQPCRSRTEEWATSAFELQPAPDAVAVLAPPQQQASGDDGGGSSPAAAAAAQVLLVYDLTQPQPDPAEGAGGRVPGLRLAARWRPGPRAAHAAAAEPAGGSDGPRFSATRYVTGTGNLHGGLVLQLQAVGPGPGAAAAPGGNVSVCVFQVVPWYVRLWLHTLQLSIDGQLASLDEALLLRHISPAEDRSRPLVLDLCLSLPAAARSVSLTGHFTKAFLTAFEHPPDAHRGFDVPSALVTFGGGTGSAAAAAAAAAAAGGSSGAGGWRVAVADGAADAEALAAPGPLLLALAQPRPRQVYAPGVIVQLAVPDFSMPYNVICLTSTVLAVFVGGVFNALLARPGEAERLAAGGAAAEKAARRRRLVKVVLVGLAFGGLALSFDTSLREQLLDAAAALGAEAGLDVPRPGA